MAEALVSKFGNDTLICIFPGGHGMTRIEGLIKHCAPYTKFIEEIKRAYKKSKVRKRREKPKTKRSILDAR